jgi:hypothetical protein
MKYVISFQGWDVEVLIDEVSEQMYRHFKDNNLDVTDHMCGSMEDELSEEITDGACFDTKFECDRLYHNCGPIMDESVTMYVNKMHPNRETDPSSLEVGEEVFKCDLNEIYNTVDVDADCEQEVYLIDFEPRYVMVGQIYSKGYSAEYILELPNDEVFDPSKLVLLYHDIDEMYEIITGVRYNDIDLECTGELSTVGKNERWYIQDTETRETTVEE